MCHTNHSSATNLMNNLAKEKQIIFKQLSMQDLALLYHWLNEEHVAKWYGERPTKEIVHQKYQSYVSGYKTIDNVKRPINAFIIYCDSLAVGYIQCYNIHDFSDDHNTYQTYNLPENTCAIDWYIGDAKMINKGVGTAVLVSFLRKYCWSKYDVCVVDPDSANASAIRVYTKVGFKVLCEGVNVTTMVKYRE